MSFQVCREDPLRKSMGSKTAFYLVFTDLDGTLLDHDTYDWGPAIPALDLCRTRGVPVILVSSKTRAEMDVLRRKLSLTGPFISENGGGIFFPVETFPDPPDGAFPDAANGVENPIQRAGSGTKTGLWRISLGVSYERLVRALEDIRSELGWDIQGFSTMGSHEISQLTGLDRQATARAAMREYDEPFVLRGVPPKDLSPLYRAAEERGLSITSGGRFYHLQGKNDKAVAMERVAGHYKACRGDVTTIALGDSPNDFAMLERADIPVLIRSQRTFPDLERRIPGLIVSDRAGPAGWNSVIWQILTPNGEGIDE